MTRISLVEAYDDKDVITQIAKIKDKLDSIPDDADLSNCVLKVNNQIIDGRKTFNDVIIANDGIAVTGDLNVDGNIVQSGVAVEVHVEEVFTKNDYITMREDAATAIPPGQFSGLQIEKYDGVNDCRLVVDDQGVARVGDVSDEQPLATRDESADMFSGALVTWDGVNNKLIAPDSDVGDDTHPVKIVDGVPSAVTDALQKELQNDVVTCYSVAAGTTFPSPLSSVRRYGQLVIVNFGGSTFADTAGTVTDFLTDLPTAAAQSCGVIQDDTSGSSIGYVTMSGTTLGYATRAAASSSALGQIIYITTDP